MADKRYRGRYAEIYLPSEKFLDRWRSYAKASRKPLSSWIFEIVEAALDKATEPVPEIETQKVNLQEDNRALRRELEKSDARLKQLETEVFKLRNEIFSVKQFEGSGSFDLKLTAALRSGGTWTGQELLRELNVEPNDSKAIEIVTRQLQALQDVELVQETAKGWRWIG